MSDKSTALKELQKISGVGKVIADDLWNLGYKSIAALAGEDPDDMYIRHNDLKGAVQDICMLYTFRCAVYFANTYGGPQDPQKLKWWYWKDEEILNSKTKDKQLRTVKGVTRGARS